MNLISVIIPAYNYADYIEATLHSVAEQSYAELECIIIDDGSTDNTGGVAKSFCEKDSRFQYYYQNNQGLAATRNAGLHKAKGRYIAFLDADDLWTSNKLLHQVKILDSQKCDLVFSNFCLLTKGEETTNHINWDQKTFTAAALLAANPIAGSSSSIIMKKEVYDKVGLFDINLRSVEDVDYWFRCALAGFEFRFCESVDVKIRTHESSMSHNFLKMYQYHFIVLEKQLALMKTPLNTKEIKPFLIDRLGISRWYAHQLHRSDLMVYTHLFGWRVLGWRYFTKLNGYNLVKDILRFVFKKKA